MPKAGAWRTKVVQLGTGTPVPDPDVLALRPQSLLTTVHILSISDRVLCVVPKQLFSSVASHH